MIKDDSAIARDPDAAIFRDEIELSICDERQNLDPNYRNPDFPRFAQHQYAEFAQQLDERANPPILTL